MGLSGFSARIGLRIGVGRKSIIMDENSSDKSERERKV